MKKTFLTLAVGLAALPAFAAKDIVDTAVGAGQFKTLTKLVTQAGLANTLKGKGPFTVLAPTDAAFAKVPKPLLAKLQKDKALLRRVLLYHVIPGNIPSSQVKTMTAKTASGETLRVRVMNGKVMFNQAQVIKADIKASNGVIHVINAVLLPPSLMKPRPMGIRASGA